uniref:Capsid protein F n=1 Tax=Cacopsylla melanoneura TaxID=428564 RepID=A0A8D8REL7_9HEMI
MSNIQTGAERMPHDLSHLGFLAGQIGRLITISTTPAIAGDSFETFSSSRSSILRDLQFFMTFSAPQFFETFRAPRSSILHRPSIHQDLQFFETFSSSILRDLQFFKIFNSP